MTGLKFELDIDAEIEKLGLSLAKPANSANQSKGVSNFSNISNYKAIISNKSERRNYQDSPSYESGWSKVFPVKGDPFWEKDGRRIKITGAELERLKSTNAGEEEKES